MKHNGSILAFTSQRNKEVMQAYRKTIAEADVINMDKIAVVVANSTYSRFWVSEERAMVVVLELDKGKPVLDSMRPHKREMFEEIYRRVCHLRNRRKNALLADIVMEVVNSTAPKLYMQPKSALDIIYKMRVGFFDKRKAVYER